MAPGAHRPAQFGVQRLDGIGRVDDPPDLIGEGEERDDLGPGAAPALPDGRIADAPGTGLECRQGLLAASALGAR